MFVSDRHGSSIWIDHCLPSASFHLFKAQARICYFFVLKFNFVCPLWNQAHVRTVSVICNLTFQFLVKLRIFTISIKFKKSAAFVVLFEILIYFCTQLVVVGPVQKICFQLKI